MLMSSSKKTFLAIALLIAILTGPFAVLPSVQAEGNVQGYLREAGGAEAEPLMDLIYGISGIDLPVFAQDLTVAYDPDQLLFIGAESLKKGLSIVDQSEKPGVIRLIAASYGKENAIQQDGDVIILHWKKLSSSSTGAASVSLNNLVLSYGEAGESQANQTSRLMSMAVASIPGDVNGDGKVTIGDLGIVAGAIGKTSADPDWEKYARADVNHDGKVDEEDLAIVANIILHGPPVPLSVNLTGAATVQAGQSFDLTYGINGLTPSVVAQDLLLTYDADKLEFVGYESVNAERFTIIDHEEKVGQVRFLGVHLDAMKNTLGANLLTLHFKAKANSQLSSTAAVSVSKLIVANGEGVESEIDGSTHQVQIIGGIPGDWNNDGRVSIGDLAIVVQSYGKTSADPDWESIKKGDLNGDGVIDIEDLVMMAVLILEQ